LPDWAKEYDYFDTGFHEEIDLTATEGTECLKEYYNLEDVDDLWKKYNTVNAMEKKIK
jgi:hypothetical protein